MKLPELKNNQKKIGVIVKELREEKGLTQKQFANKCKWSAGRQSMIEAGKVNLTLKTLQIIAKVCGNELNIKLI